MVERSVVPLLASKIAFTRAPAIGVLEAAGAVDFVAALQTIVATKLYPAGLAQKTLKAINVCGNQQVGEGADEAKRLSRCWSVPLVAEIDRDPRRMRYGRRSPRPAPEPWPLERVMRLPPEFFLPHGVWFVVPLGVAPGGDEPLRVYTLQGPGAVFVPLFSTQARANEYIGLMFGAEADRYGCLTHDRPGDCVALLDELARSGCTHVALNPEHAGAVAFAISDAREALYRDFVPAPNPPA